MDLPNTIDDSILNHVVFAIYLTYIPCIIFPSILVISAVIYMKKLHNPHNTIILAISASDLLIALVVIPVYLLMLYASNREIILSYSYLCPILYVTVDCIEVINLSILTLLGLDTFIQINFPLKYMRNNSIKKTTICIIIVVVINLCIFSVIIGQIVLRNVRCELQTSGDKESVQKIERLYALFIACLAGLLLILCFLLGLYVRIKQRKTGKETPWLLMAFILFYLPTIMVLLMSRQEVNRKDTLMILASFMRFLSPATNWIFIYKSRSTYKFAFDYFVKTKPTNWKLLETMFKLDSLSKGASIEAMPSKMSSFVVARKGLVVGLVEPKRETISLLNREMTAKGDEETNEHPRIHHIRFAKSDPGKRDQSSSFMSPVDLN